MMATIPFRFVHATQLLLDEPLAGLGLGLSGEPRRLAEDATLIAWNRIVDLCIDAQAEFLLLTGNAFHHASGSLRARVALERGFEKLDSQHVNVFIVSGPMDPVEVWNREFKLPSNVTVLADEHEAPIVIERDGEAVASIRVIASAQSDEANWSAQGPAAFEEVDAPFHIGLVGAGSPVRWESGIPEPVARPDVPRAAATLVQAAIGSGIHYLALGEGRRGTYPLRGGTAHDPGVVQSLSRQITGPCGVAVVDVDVHGKIRTAPSTVAPVRWEALGVELNADDTWDDLVEKMALTLIEREPDSDDEMWIIRWTVRGTGKVFDALAEPKSQRELWELLEAEVAEHHATRRVHQLFREAMWDQLFAASEETLGQTFMELMEQESTGLVREVQRELLEGDWADPAKRRVMTKFVETTPAHTVVSQARTAGMAWLT